ncbi:G-type lectin S-receptor-like serine/threonine-protein kinase At1g67520 isoform X2 [Neltuma alba]|uniref:G-type lectin S-receptor-like serine/threonine-protein kinase At1g67520 isoform X2 n=1 Tax=Neltuma alba TaxID=207710 RepID=UPI0010A421FD|nr:G-type lectin S-receptor-like serine/threonine-protein kinase At1g67520 isoform X2 [Prosopis alba]
MAIVVTLSIFSLICLWRTSFGAERNSLKPGDVLDHTSMLTSENRRFYLKFDSIQQYSSLTYLVIGRKDSSSEAEEDTNHGYKSWIANRNDPISNNSGVLTLEYSGALKINRQNRKPITLYSPVKSEVTKNTILTLLDSGNLVLRELHPNGVSKRVLWQSFDHPSDILLPGMKLGINHKTHQSWSVTASISDATPASGSFTLEWDPRKKQLIIKRQGQIYWASGVVKNNRFVNIPEEVQQFYEYNIVSTEEEESFSFRGKYDDESQWVLFHNGRLLDTRGSDFVIASADTCYGFNSESGCQKWKPPNCRKPGEKFQIQFEYIGSPSGNESFSVRDANVSIGESDCKATCWTNCTCLAFKTAFLNGTGCMYYHGHWRTVPVDSRDASINVLIPSPYDSDHKDLKKWKIIGPTMAAALITICLGIFYLRWRKATEVQDNGRSREENERGNLESFNRHTTVNELKNDVKKGNLKIFNYESIMEATNRFSPENLLGKGGFGHVYKGLLPMGEEIAIKRLSRGSAQGVIEFKNELIVISELQHVNLVQLLGCCIHGEERMLIYEFMPNKSLDFFLFDSTRSNLLDWKKRFNIIEGISQGLLYLHKYSRLKVVHRDLKASNILLDGNMNPKIADFGMAKIFTQESNVQTNRVVGTYGYMSPEYAMEGIFSTKSDVYSFGVLLLEIISGRRNNSFYNSQGPLNLVGQAWEQWKEGQVLDIVDPMLRDQCDPDQVLRCVHIGLLCVEENAEDRPALSDVIALLASETASIPFPTRPAFYSGRKLNKKYNSDDFETHSVNGLSVSTIKAR